MNVFDVTGIGIIVLSFIAIYWQGTYVSEGEYCDYARLRGNTQQDKVLLLSEMAKFPGKYVRWRRQLIASFFIALAIALVLMISKQPVNIGTAFVLVFVLSFMSQHFVMNYYVYHGFEHVHTLRADEIEKEMFYRHDPEIN